MTVPKKPILDGHKTILDGPPGNHRNNVKLAILDVRWTQIRQTRKDDNVSGYSSRFEAYTKEQLLYFSGIVNILLIYVYNIATVGWQLVHYTVYGTKKSDNGLGFASSIIAFLRPVNCIVDSPPFNICIIIT